MGLILIECVSKTREGITLLKQKKVGLGGRTIRFHLFVWSENDHEDVIKNDSKLRL